MDIAVKRVYAVADPADGTRILVDRLWPRGLSKEKACVAVWLREVAPSTALREWFGHNPARWPAFRQRYWAELEACEALPALRQHVQAGRVTLVYAAKDKLHNNAVALRDFLLRDS